MYKKITIQTDIYGEKLKKIKFPVPLHAVLQIDEKFAEKYRNNQINKMKLKLNIAIPRSPY